MGGDGASGGVLAENRRARHDYFLDDPVEAGLVLRGSEVKALRQRGASIAEAYVKVRDGEAFLENAHVPRFPSAHRFDHEERRSRKLLLKRREIDRLAGGVQRAGKTVVPLKLYFNGRGIAKLLIALGTGKKARDQREDRKRRDWQRQRERLLRRPA